MSSPSPCRRPMLLDNFFHVRNNDCSQSLNSTKNANPAEILQLHQNAQIYLFSFSLKKKEKILNVTR